MKRTLLLCVLVAAIGCEKKDDKTKHPDPDNGGAKAVKVDTSVPQEPDPPEIAAGAKQYLMGDYDAAIATLQPLFDDLKQRNQYRASALAGTWLALAHAEQVFENGKEPAEWAASMAESIEDKDVDNAAKVAMAAYLIGNEEFDQAATSLEGAGTAKDPALVVMAQLLRAEALIGAAFGSGDEAELLKDPEKLEVAKQAYDAAAGAAKGSPTEKLLNGRIEEGYAALADYKKKKDEVCAHATAAFQAFKDEGATRLLEGPAKLATANKCAIPGLEDAN
jgi:hypothetical protein